MNKNEFIAFRCLYDRKLLKAVENENVNEINFILNAEYYEEKGRQYYKNETVDINKIKHLYNQFIKEIEGDPSIIHRL